MIEKMKKKFRMIEPVFEEKRKPLEVTCGVCGLSIPVMDELMPYQADGLASTFDSKGGYSAFGSEFDADSFEWTGVPLIQEETDVCDGCIEKWLAEEKIRCVGNFLLDRCPVL